MSEYIFVTNIFEYSNIRIYSSHSVAQSEKHSMCGPKMYTGLGWGWGELRVLDHRPASRNFSLAPKICLRTLTSHQKELFQRKETLHYLMCTGKFTQTGATLTVFTVYLATGTIDFSQFLNCISLILG